MLELTNVASMFSLHQFVREMDLPENVHVTYSGDATDEYANVNNTLLVSWNRKEGMLLIESEISSEMEQSVLFPWVVFIFGITRGSGNAYVSIDGENKQMVSGVWNSTLTGLAERPVWLQGARAVLEYGHE